MKHLPSRSLLAAIAAAYLCVPHLQAAPLKPSHSFAFTAPLPGGTHLWAAIPDVASYWSIVVYARRPAGPSWWRDERYIYRPLVSIDKPTGVGGVGASPYYQLMTVPFHTERECVLAAYRNGIQVKYHGFTQAAPFGWHTFGSPRNGDIRVTQMPASTPILEVRNYQRQMQRQWSAPNKWLGVQSPRP